VLGGIVTFAGCSEEEIAYRQCLRNNAGEGGADGSGGSGGSSICSEGSCAECQQCAAEADCAEEANACAENAACVAVYTCIADCSTDACIEDCLDAYPDGTQDYTSFAVCINCDACIGPCAPTGC
jgi:hypothetical protein